MPAINGSSGVAHWVSATEKNATPPNQPTTIEEDEDKRHRAEKEVLTLDIWTNERATHPTHSPTPHMGEAWLVAPTAQTDS